ncbi:nitrous oxide-stimulated promoter family protein [Porphyromonas miyakawae]|uniref:nitrous oxide-stimulated promoter family protein n=1 Tax=Porphyromonas miyakawae TaxID=3137470 RepID=UPI00398C646D
MKHNIEEEKKVVEYMIRLYCSKKEGHRELCPECRQLLAYASNQLDHCRFASLKPTCRKCPIHCYRPEMKARIRTIMRWAGPRMLFYHPIAAIRHVIREL